MSSSNSHPQIILFLVANPKDTTRLRLEQELRDIEEGLQRAQQRDQFGLKKRLATRPRDIQRAMLDLSPKIIHFSGHGGAQGLVFEDEIGNAKVVDGKALANLFALFADRVSCVVLNGCYSEVQAREICQYIPYVVGMNKAIGDKAAIAFSVGFYDALGAGRDVDFAYELGCAAIQLEGLPESLAPILLKKSTVEGRQAQSDEARNNLSNSSTPTVFPRERLNKNQRRKLEMRRVGLEEEWCLLNEKLKRLRRAKLIETDPSVEFKLEQQLEEVQQTIICLEQELDEIEQKISSTFNF